jgi:hypothetical protein
MRDRWSAGAIFATRKTFVVADARLDLACRRTARSAIGGDPGAHQRRAIGAIGARPGTGAFTSQEVDLVSTFADQAAVAIEGNRSSLQ